MAEALKFVGSSMMSNRNLEGGKDRGGREPVKRTDGEIVVLSLPHSEL